MTEPDFSALIDLVLDDPDDAGSRRRLVGALFRSAPESTPDLDLALGVLLRADDVKHERLGPALERSILRRYSVDDHGVVPDPGTIEGDDLFIGLLTKAFVRSPDMEAFCVALRSIALHDRSVSMALVAALAMQAFNNEYLFAARQTDLDEAEALLGSDDVEDVVRGAMFKPLPDEVRNRLRGVDAPSPAVADALRVLVHEPLHEEHIASTIPVHGRIADTVSIRVREQYEEHPFPRWLSIGADHRTLAHRFPTGVPTPDDRFPSTAIDILVPGCGTGQHPLTLALGNPDASVLGVDLSRASLAYARRKADDAGVDNLELLQADLLDLPTLGRSFHHIDCVGVLHHLGDPMAGWRALVEVLEPGGTLHIGVYGKAPRLPIQFVRDDVARLGLHPTEGDMRRYREVLRTDPTYATVQRAVRGGGPTMSHLRDTLFHASEYRYSLVEVETTLDELGLRLLWVDLRGPLERRYRQRFGDEILDDFERWREFEPAYTASLRMFEFWVEKAA